MSKISGIGERFYVNQYDLSGDVGALGTIQAARNQQDVTVLADVAIERLGLLRDGHLAYTAFFDTVTGQEHLVLRNLPQSALITWATGTTAGADAASLVANHTDYPVTRGADGSLVTTPTADANGYGMQWGNLLTAGAQLFASAGIGTAVDDYFPSFGGISAPPTNFGLAAYLHVLSIGSGSATVHIQDSAAGVSYADVTGAVFSAAGAATSQRIATSATQAVNRYLRLNVTGTFTNLVCVVSVVRYISEFMG
jgi:hypothetical protein